MNKKSQTYEEDVITLTIGSVCLNIILIIIKLCAGFLFGSFSLIADGFHSVSDLVTDLIVVLGVKISNNPPDDDHHYGHGKFETFAELIVSFCILGTGLSIVYIAGGRIFNPTSDFLVLNEFYILIASFSSIVIKEILYQWTYGLSLKWKSSILKTNAWHHRSDAISSLIVLFGMVISLYGIEQADVFAGLIVGMMIFVVGAQFFKKAIHELLETAPSKEIKESIKKILDQVGSVKNHHNIRVRRMGSRLFMDMHVMLEPSLSLKVSHDISVEIELKLRQFFGKKINVLIHLEPFEEIHHDLDDFS